MAIFHGVYAAKKQIALFPLWSVRTIRLVGRIFRSNLLNGSIATLQVPIFSSFCQNARYVVMRFHDIQQIQNSSYFFLADFKEGFKWWIKASTFIVKRYLTSSRNKNRTDIQFYVLSLQKAFFFFPLVILLSNLDLSLQQVVVGLHFTFSYVMPEYISFKIIFPGSLIGHFLFPWALGGHSK